MVKIAVWLARPGVTLDRPTLERDTTADARRRERGRRRAAAVLTVRTARGCVRARSTTHGDSRRTVRRGRTTDATPIRCAAGEPAAAATAAPTPRGSIVACTTGRIRPRRGCRLGGTASRATIVWDDAGRGYLPSYPWQRFVTTLTDKAALAGIRGVVAGCDARRAR